MNDTLCRGAWDKGCTDIMYMIIEYQNYPIISLLTQPRGYCVNMLYLLVPCGLAINRRRHFLSGIILIRGFPKIRLQIMMIMMAETETEKLLFKHLDGTF